jgi:hypothetical protein
MVVEGQILELGLGNHFSCDKVNLLRTFSSEVCVAAMRNRIVLLVTFASLLTAQTGVIAVVHGRVIDGRRGPIMSDSTVLIRGKRVDAIDATSSVSVVVRNNDIRRYAASFTSPYS